MSRKLLKPTETQSKMEAQEINIVKDEFANLFNPIQKIVLLCGSGWVCSRYRAVQKLYSIGTFMLLTMGTILYTASNVPLLEKPLIKSENLLRIYMMVFLACTTLFWSGSVRFMMNQNELGHTFDSLITIQAFSASSAKKLKRLVSILTGTVISSSLMNAFSIGLINYVLDFPVKVTMFFSSKQTLWISCWVSFSFTTIFTLMIVVSTFSFVYLYEKVKQFNQNLTDNLEIQHASQLVNCSRDHFHLVKILKTMNGTWGIYLLVGYGIIIMITVISIYTSITTGASTNMIIFINGWLAFYVMTFSGPYYGALKVTDELNQTNDCLRHATNKYLSAFNSDNVETLWQDVDVVTLNNFKYDVTNSDISVTAADAFNVTRESLITVTSAVVSYLLIMYQFAPTSKLLNDVSNSTTGTT